MARSRYIKPTFFTNDALGGLRPLARLLFIGLWCLADREGRLEDRPKRIKAELLPYDVQPSVEELLQSLHAAGFIERYEVAGERLIQVVNFSKHQKPHYKEAPSIIQPSPDLESRLSQSWPDVEPTLIQSDRSLEHSDSDSDSNGEWRMENGERRTENGPASGKPITVPALSPAQQETLDYLHAQTRTQIHGGATAPDFGWCEDLARRGMTRSDVDHAINASGGKGQAYVRSILERRVGERVAGGDPDASAARARGGIGTPVVGPAEQERVAQFARVIKTGLDEPEASPGGHREAAGQ